MSPEISESNAVCGILFYFIFYFFFYFGYVIFVLLFFDDFICFLSIGIINGHYGHQSNYYLSK